MLISTRNGRILARSLPQIFSSPIASRSSNLLRIQLQRQSSQTCSRSIRPFSSFPRFQQQATARYEQQDAGESDVQTDSGSEFGEFRELAEHGVVDRKIIENLNNKMNIHIMTPVQRMTINECLDGADVIAQAKTGTGKTLAFLMPIVQRMMRDSSVTRDRASAADIRALIISPTRELAEQIAVEAKKVVSGTGLVVQTAVGGTQKSYHLSMMQRQGCHILVGTPGRVKDLLSDNYSGVKLNNIETFVLDEADRLLDIGFAPDIEEIQSYMPSRREKDRQTLMFSATVPKSVVSLVRQTMRPDFKFVRTIDPSEAPTHESVPQKVVFLPGLQNQIPAILEIATNAIEAHKKDPQNNMPFKAIVYFSSLNEVNLATTWLENLREPSSRSMFNQHPLAPCQIIQMSSKLDQRQRTRNSEYFRKAESAILCSSDVTARGMDFPNVSHVIQIGLPKTMDDYIHRVGRTGRAGKSGEGWLLLDQSDRREWNHRNHELKLEEDTSLHTANLDMTRGAQLPANVARIMQLVESGIKAVPFAVKAQTYASLISVLNQQGPRNKQSIVDMINDLSRYGWGLEKPPGISPSLADKLGVSRCQGLEISDRFERGDRDSDRGRRDPFGKRDTFDPKDPFGDRPSRGRDGGRDRFGGSSDRRRRDPFEGGSGGRDRRRDDRRDNDRW